MKPGRNDPCPCGSGKKYKHCCQPAERPLPSPPADRQQAVSPAERPLPTSPDGRQRPTSPDGRLRADSPADVAWVRVRRALDGMPRQLARFVAEVHGPKAVEQAWDDFTLWEGPAYDPESPLVPLFMPWLYHSWRPHPYEPDSLEDRSLHQRTPSSVFLERRGPRLEPLFARYLSLCIDAPFSFHEVLRCDPGHGFRVRDLIVGEEREVLERLASQTMRAGDVLFAQLVPIEGIVLLEACSPYALSPIDKIRIIELREHIEFGLELEPDARDPRHAFEMDIREVFFELIERFLDPRPPVLHNTDGHVMKLQRVVFDIDDAERALAELVRAARTTGEVDVRRGADGRLKRARFAWLKARNRGRGSAAGTVLGSVEVTAAKVVAYVNSDERAKAFRGVVKRALGDGARYRTSELVEEFEQINEDALEHLALGPGGSEEDLAEHPEVRAHMSRLVEQHYKRWPTQKIPALGNRRPIDVVKEANGREKVEALLAEMERSAAATGGEDSSAALARLRERLGLARYS